MTVCSACLSTSSEFNILSSARPLHRVLKGYLKRRKKHDGDGGDGVLVDPHKRVDTSQFLLQRTRRISWALAILEELGL